MDKMTTKRAKQIVQARGQRLPPPGRETVVEERKRHCGCYQRVWLTNNAGKFSTRLDWHTCDICWFKLPVRA